MPPDDGGGLVADAVGLCGLSELGELGEEAVEAEGLAEHFEGLEAEVFGVGVFGEVQEDGEDLLDVEQSGVLGDGLLGVHGGMVAELVCGWQVGVGWEVVRGLTPSFPRTRESRGVGWEVARWRFPRSRE